MTVTTSLRLQPPYRRRCRQHRGRLRRFYGILARRRLGGTGSGRSGLAVAPDRRFRSRVRRSSSRCAPDRRTPAKQPRHLGVRNRSRCEPAADRRGDRQGSVRPRAVDAQLCLIVIAPLGRADWSASRSMPGGDGTRSFTRRIRRILLGVDGSSASDAAIDWACQEAAIHGAELLVAHVSEPGTPPDRGDVIVERATEECRRWVGDAALDFSAQGSPRALLLALTRDRDLVVVGSRGRAASRPAVRIGGDGARRPRFLSRRHRAPATRASPKRAPRRERPLSRIRRAASRARSTPRSCRRCHGHQS